MADITHEQLHALATRIEDSTRREVDRVRDELSKDIRAVHHRVGEVRDDVEGVQKDVKLQNGRVRRSEVAIAVLQWAVGLIGIVALALLSAFVQKVWP